MSNVYTQIVEQSFVGPDTNPLDPTNWTKFAQDNDLQQRNNFCEATVLAAVNFCGARYTNATWQNGMYAEITVNHLDMGDYATVFVLADDNFTAGYYVGAAHDGSNFTLTCQGLAGAAPVLFTASQPYTDGVVVRLEVFQGEVTAFLNGTQVGTATNSDTTSGGAPGIEISANTSISDSTLSFFSAGAITAGQGNVYSVPDDRNYNTFPNDAINVQDTETFIIPSVDSRAAGKPVDSRVGGPPIDSRVSSIIPLNSRTPGIYGPGD
jgi:hypothetical protein